MDTLANVTAMNQVQLSGHNSNDGQVLGNLFPDPQVIRSIGSIIALHGFQDFPLIEAGQTMIRCPHSLRATLVQVGSDMHDAFDQAQGNMQMLGFEMGTVREHITHIIMVLQEEQMSPPQRARHIGHQLGSLAKMGDRFSLLARNMEAHFQKVGGVIQLVIELIQAKQDVTKKAIEKARQDKSLQEKRCILVNDEAKESKETSEALDEQLKAAQQNMMQVMGQKPSVGLGQRSAWQSTVQAAMDLLQKTETSRDAERNRLRDLEEQVLKEQEKFVRIKISEPSFDEERVLQEMLQQFLQLGQCQEAWSSIIKFFDLCKQQLTHPFELTDGCLEDVNLGDLKDHLHRIVMSADSMQRITAVYCDVSERHLLPATQGLGAIYLMTNTCPELSSKKAALMSICDAAVEAVLARE